MFKARICVNRMSCRNSERLEEVRIGRSRLCVTDVQIKISESRKASIAKRRFEMCLIGSLHPEQMSKIKIIATNHASWVLISIVGEVADYTGWTKRRDL